MVVYAIDIINRGNREIQGVKVRIEEAKWSDDTSTWSVFHIGTGKDLFALDTEFNHDPTDDEIVDLLRAQLGWWICQGCGKAYRAHDKPLVHSHIDTCDLWQFYIKQERRQ